MKTKIKNILGRFSMSTFFILIFSFSICHASTIAVPANYLSLNSGLVGYWTMDGKDVVNGVAIDKTGNNNLNVNNIATSTFYAPGKMGQGFNFDGSDDFARKTSPSNVSFTTVFSLSGWIKTRDISGNIVSRTDGIAYGYSLVVGDTTQDGKARIWLDQDAGGGSADAIRPSVNTVNDGKWHHIVGVYDGPNARLDLYVDGVISTASIVGSVPASITTQARPLYVGADGSGLAQRHLTGNIDDVRIYSRALSAQEVAQLYNIGAATKVDTSPTASSSPLTSGLVGYWTMDGKDVVNGVALDKSGNGNNGNLISIATSTFYKAGKIGQGFNFDGVDDYVNVADNANLDFGPNQDFSYEFWIKPNKSSNAFINKRAGGGAGYAFYDSGGSHALGFFDSSNNFYGFNFNLSLSLSSNVWTHIVAVFDRDANLTVYKNGTSFNSTSISSGSTVDISNTSILRIGEIFGGGRPVGGIMDNVRIYNRALSAQEVTQLYSLGAATKIDVSPTASSSPLIGNGLVGYWTFDGKDVVNGVARDKSGNGNNSNLINIATSTFYAPGKIGQGIRCDGVNDYTSATDSTSLRLSNRFTISNWLKLDSTTQASYIQTKRNAQDEYAVVYGYVAGKYEFYAEGFSGGVPRTPLTTSVTDKKWHHVVWTYDGTRLRGYLDGNLDVTATITFTLLQTTGALRYCTSNAATDFYKGYIDDPRIYNRQLSDQEIKALYGLGR